MQKNMSEINDEDIFEREIRLCEDFSFHQETEDVKIRFNVSSTQITIWVYYNENWKTERGTKILNTLLKRRKLDQVGYQVPWIMKRYPEAEWKEREKTCEYKCLCPNFKFDPFFIMKIIENMTILTVILRLTIKRNCNYDFHYFRLDIKYCSGLCLCVCEENYNDYARCRNKNCTQFHPFTFPRKAFNKTGKESTMSLPRSWRD